ncbi:hypothetical protein GCM10009840_04090 [Pseudolysinimonas kribbensis]
MGAEGDEDHRNAQGHSDREAPDTEHGSEYQHRQKGDRQADDPPLGLGAAKEAAVCSLSTDLAIDAGAGELVGRGMGVGHRSVFSRLAHGGDGVVARRLSD